MFRFATRLFAAPQPLVRVGFQSTLRQQTQPSPMTIRSVSTFNQIIRKGLQPKIKKVKAPALDGCPQKKAVCLKIFAVKPKKPNSAQRKCARVRLSNGRVVIAYIPGEGHNLQEHSVVLVRGGVVQDCPGIRYRVLRGALDCQGVIGRTKGRSKVIHLLD